MEFLWPLGFTESIESLFDASDGGRGGAAFARRGGAFKQRLDLSQPFAKLLFSGHRNSQSYTADGRA
jgi:hypothetical protein